MAGYRYICCIDTVGFGIAAFHVIVPDDWIWYGGMVWVGGVGVPTVVQVAVVGPEGAKAFEVIPDHIFPWVGNPLAGLSLAPLLLSPYVSAAAPIAPDQAIIGHVLPRYRQQMQPNPAYAERSKEFTYQRVAEAIANSGRMMAWSRQMSAQNDQWLAQQAQRREVASREFERHRQEYQQALDRPDPLRKWTDAFRGDQAVIDPQTGQEQRIEGGHVDASINNLGQILSSDVDGILRTHT
jgi:hypothetical protein